MSSTTYAKPHVQGPEVSPFAVDDVVHLWRRAGATVIDSMFLSLLGLVLLRPEMRPILTVTISRAHDSFSASMLPTTQFLLHLALDAGLALTLVVVYYSAFEWVFACTPGKTLFGLRVVDFSGSAISLDQALVRNVMRIVDALPCGLYLPGWLFAISGARRQRLGDKGAGTLVVSRAAVRRLGLEPEVEAPPPVSFLTARQV